MADDAVGASRDASFLGAIPDVYQRLLVPMVFESPAESLAAVVAGLEPRTILETAAGTGALTRALTRSCPRAAITATDLNQPMLDAAARSTRSGTVSWRQADALDLPFSDDSYDVVVCQFGVMFFPDRVRGHREAARVLRPGGTYVFSTWDHIETSEIPFVIQAALVAAAPEHPLTFMSRRPHGYFSPYLIRADLEAAGLTDVAISPVTGMSRTTAVDAAVAFCQGTPFRAEIEQHETLDVAQATAIAQRALTRHFGRGPIEAPIRWLEIVARPGA